MELTSKGKLNRVFLVNSGSEATDLAMRIARTVVTERRRQAAEARYSASMHAHAEPHRHQKQEEQEAGEVDRHSALGGRYSLNRDTICLTGGYHGVTTASDEVSTTLNDNPR